MQETTSCTIVPLPGINLGIYYAFRSFKSKSHIRLGDPIAVSVFRPFISGRLQNAEVSLFSGRSSLAERCSRTPPLREVIAQRDTDCKISQYLARKRVFVRKHTLQSYDSKCERLQKQLSLSLRFPRGSLPFGILSLCFGKAVFDFQDATDP